MVPQEAWNTEAKQAPQFSLSPPFDLSRWASLVAQTVKNLPALRESWVKSLDWEDPREKEMVTHFSILAWRIPWTEATVHGVTESDINEQLTLWLSSFEGTLTHWAQLSRRGFWGIFNADVFSWRVQTVLYHMPDNPARTAAWRRHVVLISFFSILSCWQDCLLILEEGGDLR